MANESEAPGVKMSVRLQDWQGENRAVEAASALDLHLTIRDDGLIAETTDGRAVKIEFENGALRIHGYDPGSESPANMEMPQDGEISVDDTDYRNNRLNPDTGP